MLNYLLWLKVGFEHLTGMANTYPDAALQTLDTCKFVSGSTKFVVQLPL